MTGHFDIEENCRRVRAQLAALDVPEDASEASKMKLRHPEMLVATARMIMTELNNGRENAEILEAMIENFVDHVLSLSGGPDEITRGQIDAVLSAVRRRIVSAVFEQGGQFVDLSIENEPGGHA